jgi:hypothetical protein
MLLSLMIYVGISSSGAKHSQHIHERTTFFTQVVSSACTRTGTYELIERKNNDVNIGVEQLRHLTTILKM